MKLFRAFLPPFFIFCLVVDFSGDTHYETRAAAASIAFGLLAAKSLAPSVWMEVKRREQKGKDSGSDKEKDS